MASRPIFRKLKQQAVFFIFKHSLGYSALRRIEKMRPSHIEPK